MIEVGNHALGQMIDIQPMTPFADASDILANALPLLDAPSRITPTEAAKRFIRVETRGVWQSFDPDVTPYMIEPADTTLSRMYRGGAFVGPSQAGKTMCLITTALHPVLCDPAPTLVMHMDRASRDRWVEESLNPVIHGSPAALERLGRAREDDTFSRKRFVGMRLMLGYPTPQWLSSAKYRLVCLTDYDHFPPELGMSKDAPEGSPFSMAIERTKTFMSRGFVFAESTPAWPVTDLEFEQPASHPHMFPPVDHGIVPLYNTGTRGRWYWECKDCGELYEPRFERLHFDDSLPPLDAGEGAEMECPHCHALTGPRFKNELNRAAAKGRGGWLHEAEFSGELVPLGDSAIRQTEIASWALDGAAATFAPWSSLVSRYIDAVRRFEDSEDPVDLQRFYFTSLGRPFARPASVADGELSVAALKEARTETPRGVAPDWVVFIMVTADVQNARFPVQVTGFGVDGRRTVIDRFDLFTPPDEDGQPRDRALSPAKYASDWAVLAELDQRRWPIEGTEWELRATALAVDFQGEPGVSDNAELFWLGRKKAGEGARWFLTRGHGGFRQRDRVWHEAPERSNKKGGKGRRIKLLNMATDRLKDTVTASLMRPGTEARSYPLPKFLTDDQLAEFCAEERTDNGWVPKKGQRRNESLDLSVQAQALAEHKGFLRMNPESPWNWATLGDANPHCFQIAQNPTPEQKTPRGPRRARIGKMRL